MRWKSVIWTILCTILLIGAIWLVKLFWLRPVNIEDFFERIAYEQAELDPAHFVHLPATTRDHFSKFRVSFRDYSPTFYENRAKLSTNHLQDLKAYSLKYLTETQRISQASLTHELSQNISAASFKQQHFLIHSFSIENDPIFFLLFQQPVTNTDEAKAYITRMRQVGKSYNQLIIGLKNCETQNLLPPSSLVRAKISQLKQFIAIPTGEHPLYLQYAQQIVRIPRMEITQFEQIDYLKSVEKRISEDIFPACERLIAYLETLLPKTKENYSEAFFADNHAFYKHLLKGYLGEEFSPEELQQKGKEYLEKDEATNDQLEGNLELFPTTNKDSLKKVQIKHFKEMLEKTAFKWEGILGTSLPENPEIKFIPEIPFGLDTYYKNPGFSGKTNAQLFLKFNPNKSYLLSDIFALSIPGQHFQVQQQLLNKNQPYYMRLLEGTALQNGWQLYSQKIAEEYGFYGNSEGEDANDLSGLRQHLHNLRLYAALLVIDTGIFSQSWTPAQAVSYLMDSQIIDAQKAQMWVNRVLAQPGKYTSYWMGYQKILELRAEAKEKQGLNFNIADFHQWIIKHQTLPLGDLGVFFEEYLEK